MYGIYFNYTTTNTNTNDNNIIMIINNNEERHDSNIKDVDEFSVETQENTRCTSSTVLSKQIKIKNS